MIVGQFLFFFLFKNFFFPCRLVVSAALIHSLKETQTCKSLNASSNERTPQFSTLGREGDASRIKAIIGLRNQVSVQPVPLLQAEGPAHYLPCGSGRDVIKNTDKLPYRSL